MSHDGLLRSCFVWATRNARAFRIPRIPTSPRSIQYWFWTRTRIITLITPPNEEMYKPISPVRGSAETDAEEI